MLKLIENINADTAKNLSKVFPKDLVSSYVLFSLLDWYAVDGAWVQTEDDHITALLVEREHTKLYVTATKDADLFEIAEFIRCLGGLVVHCSSEITGRIGVTGFSKISLMRLKTLVGTGKSAITVQDDLRSVFNLLTANSKQIMSDSMKAGELKKIQNRAYQEWLSKTSRGILNGYTTVKVIQAAEKSILSAAVADRLENRIYIRDVATDSEYRQMGYASDCVRGLCADLKEEENEIFLACDDLQTENFYKKLGFERTDYIDMGIVEL